jgi:clan AA aspartic protease
MGIVHAEITLRNAGDVAAVQHGYIRENQVRASVVNALVDTGCGSLVITEEVSKALGLTVKRLSRSTLADGSKPYYQVTEPVEIHWKDRETACPAIVVPGTEEVLLGAIPLEGLDLMVDPTRQILTGVHGDEPLFIINQPRRRAAGVWLFW